MPSEGPAQAAAHPAVSSDGPGRLAGGDAQTVERELARQPGVVRVYVNPLTEMAYVEYDASRCSLADLTATIRRAGYGGTTQ